MAPFYRYALPIAAVVGVILGGIAVYFSLKKPPTPPICCPPPKSPFEHFIAAEGLIEASSENIEIGSPFNELVKHVYVRAGDYVAKDSPLFQLDLSIRQKQLEEAKESFEHAEAEYKKQLDLPRPEDIPISEAIVKQAQARLLDKTAQFEIVEKIENPQAVSRDEFNQRKYAALLTKFELDEAEANLNKLLAGAWVKDLEINRAQVREAKAHMEVIEQEIVNSTITAPFEGVVMEVNIHPGEFAAASGSLNYPLVLFGKFDPLHIRIDIDETEVWRLIEGSEAVAYMRGNSAIHVPLKFVRLHPYLRAKSQLTGGTAERVDTRVLQLIYEFQDEGKPIFPGMLMDVYLESKPLQT